MIDPLRRVDVDESGELSSAGNKQPISARFSRQEVAARQKAVGGRDWQNMTESGESGRTKSAVKSHMTGLASARLG